MKTGLKILGALVVLVVAIVVAGIVVLKSTDYNRFKGDLDKIVQDATGREFTIGGDLDLVLSLNPTLSVSDVTFANADWGRDVPMMRLDRLDAKVALRPLLSGKLDVEYIVLNGLDLVLETDGKGKANWEFTQTQPAPSQPLSDGTMTLTPEVRDVRLRNVNVTYIDGATGAEIKTNLKRADFAAATIDSPLKGELEATFNDVAVEAQAELGSLGLLIATEGEPFPVNLKVSAPGLLADIVGTVDQPSAGMGLNARLTAKASNMKTLSKLAGIDLTRLPGIDLRANLSGQGTAYGLKGLDAKVGDSDLKGNVDVTVAGKRPVVGAKLSSNFLDLDTLLGLDGKTSEPQTKPERLFTNAPLPLDVLKIADGDVNFSAKRLKADAFKVQNLTAGVKLKGGKLTLNPLRFTFDGGRISARATVDDAGKTPKVSVKASVRGLDAGQVAALAGHGGMVSIKMDGEVDVKGTGDSLQAIMGGLEGETNLVGRNGRIYDEAFTDLTEGVGDLLPWASSKDANVISCVMVKLPITNGVADAETVVVDTSGVLVKVTGNIDLGGERLHLTVHTDAKKASLASFAVPVRVKGSFVEPRIDVDPGEAVVGTVGNIVKAPAELIGGLLSDTLSLVESDEEKKEAAAKDDPCIQALSGGKTPAKATTKAPKQAEPKAKQSSPPPQDKPVDPSKSSGDPVKDVKKLGEALKNLF